jgi:uncharacterized protein YbjT (DUF2867 family)
MATQTYHYEPVDKKLIAVVGATGQQGGAVVDAILALNDPFFKIRAITHDKNSREAKTLASKGCEIVEATWHDEIEARKAFNKCWGVFCMTTPFGKGQSMEKETQDGIRMVDAAFEDHVSFFLYSSVGGAERNTKIPHFESKRRVEEHLLKRASRGEMKTGYFILRPVFFLENFENIMPPKNGIISMPLSPNVKLQMVALEDIGKCVARILSNPDRYRGHSLEFAGCSMTGEQIAKTFSKVTGRTFVYQKTPKVMEKALLSSDMQTMFDWLEREGFQADLDKIGREYVGDTMNMEKWLKRKGYDKPQNNAKFGSYEDNNRAKGSLLVATLVGVFGVLAYWIYHRMSTRS